MHYEKSVEVAATPAAVWAVLMDVEAWPTWTASMRTVELLGEGPLRFGSEVRITQPKLPKAVWTVTSFDPERGFAWSNTSPGISSVGDHRIEASGVGTKVTLSIDQSGPIGAVFGILFGRMTRRYVDTEAAGLKAQSEKS